MEEQTKQIGKKKELGKGIRALLSSMDTELSNNPNEVIRELSGSVIPIPLKAIEVNPFQPRTEFDELALKELANSIKIHGLIQPLTLRRLNQDAYQLISGERRFRAAKLAGLVEIPAYIRVANDQEMLEMALVENIQREDLNAVEIAITYQRLLDECNLTHENLSGRVGKDRSTVTNYLRLLKLPPEIQASIKNKQISMGHARALAGVQDIALQLMLFHQIAKEDLSVRAVEALIKKYGEAKELRKEKPEGIPEVYLKVQQDLSAKSGVKVSVKVQANGQGNITFPFKNDAELNQILEALGE